MARHRGARLGDANIAKVVLCLGDGTVNKKDPHPGREHSSVRIQITVLCSLPSCVLRAKNRKLVIAAVGPGL